ncbi:peroxiredoxin type-2 [Ancistrocladus abbreviatus]
MDVAQLQRQYIERKVSLFREGLLDDQFNQLQKLADESRPKFVVEVVSLFLEDSEKLLNNLTKAIEQPVVNFKQVADYAHQFKGSSSSIGAQRIKNICISFKNYSETENLEGCLRCLHQVKQEFALFKNKLETLFSLEQQIVAAGGVIPPP